jgi:uncharacterized protein (TIGR03067 family)
LKVIETTIEAERTAIDTARAAVERSQTDLERHRQEIEATRVELAAAQRALEAERYEFRAEREVMASQTQTEEAAADNPADILEGELLDSEGRSGQGQSLDGSWKLIAVEAFGREIPALSLRRQRIVWEFKGNRLLHRPEIGHLRESTFELDPTTTPGRIAVIPLNGRPKYGIYSLENDRLRVGIYKDKNQLPTAFSTRAGDGLRILVFRREAGDS